MRQPQRDDADVQRASAPARRPSSAESCNHHRKNCEIQQSFLGYVAGNGHSRTDFYHDRGAPRVTGTAHQRQPLSRCYKPPDYTEKSLSILHEALSGSGLGPSVEALLGLSDLS